MKARHAVASLAIEVDRPVLAVAEDAPDELGENAARAHLDEGAHAARVHRLNLFDEANRLRELRRERVAHRARIARIRLRGGVAKHVDRGLAHGDRLEVRAKRRARTRDDRAVERSRDGQSLRGDALGRERGFDGGDAGRGSRHDHLRGRVVVGDHHVAAALGEEPGDLFDGKGDREHRARGRGRFAHQLAAPARHGHEGLAIEHARSVECCDFAVAVATDARRRHADRPKHAFERAAVHSERRLRPLGGGEARRLRLAIGVAENGARKRDAVKALAIKRDRGSFVPRRTRDVEGHRDVGAHADVLAPLPRINKRDRAGLGCADAVVNAGGRAEGRRRGLVDRGCCLREFVRQLGRRRGDHREARGVGHAKRLLALTRSQRQLARAARERATTGRELDRARGREQHQLTRRSAQPPRRARAARGRELLERDVEVAATEAERRHRRAARVRRVADPRARLGVQVKRAPFDRELRVRALDLDRGRKHLVVKRHDRLEQPGGSGGGLGVADLRFHAAERAPLRVRSLCVAERELEALELGGVAGLGARAVRFDELHGAGAVTRARVRATKRARLTFGHGRIDALAPAVGRSAHAANDRVHVIAVALGIGEALERDHREALAEQRAVGRVGEGSAVAGRRQGRRLAEAHVHEDVVEGVDAAGDHEVRLPELQLVEPHRQRRHGARAGRVGDGVGATQIEAVRDAPGHHVSEQARERRLLPRHVVARDAIADRLRLGFGYAALAQRLHPDRALQAAHHRSEQLLRRRHAENHADALAVHRGELIAARVLEHALRHDERQNLRGVGRGHDARRHAELHRVKLHRRQKRAALAVRLVRSRRVWIVIILREPMGRRNLRDEIASREDVGPEAARVGRAGKERAHADDGDGDLQGRSSGHLGKPQELIADDSGRGRNWNDAALIGAPWLRS